jgi:ABC-2 type transport system permease protein
MRTLRSEWVKLRSDPGLVALMVALTLAPIAIAALGAGRAELPVCPDMLTNCELPVVDRIKLSLSGVFFGQTFAVVLATLTVADEYTTGLLGTTLLAIPRRLAVVAAKAATTVGVVALAGAAAVAASVVVAGALLPRRGFAAGNGYPPMVPTDPAVLRAAGGSVLYLCLVALLAIGIAFAVRDTTAVLATVLSLLYLIPLIGIALNNETLTRLIERYAPMPAGLSIQTTIAVEALPISGWAGQAVLAGWSGCAIIAGWISFEVRDA